MRTRSLALVALTAAGALALGGCGGGREGTADAAAAGAGDGFADDAVIGVSLPWLGTQNWAEAQEMFTTRLTEAGFEPLVQAADNKVTQQQQQIEAMIERGAEVIVVGPVDGTQLGSVLERAAAEGIAVIGYDRLIENTPAVDAVVQFGSLRTGELQGQSLLDGLAARKGEPPYHVELFGGGPADPNAPAFFEGAMSVLQPKIDDGTLVVGSGQTEFTQAATPDWDNAKAQARMDSLLSGFYSAEEIDGVLSPNDGIARAVMTSAQQAGQETPVVTGLDAENESVVSVWQGQQWSTVAKPTVELVGRTVELIQSLQQGEALPEPDEEVDNGQTDVAVYLLDPLVVTQENAQEVFADDPNRLQLLQ
ncbi:putative sugar uptake ABC transporter periplasmic solute-binding protein precursor [Cellulomonas flavigena DSM 20109]|uniref:Putative sugar uptake ABC transporter periplasmic solute-binding protein n=1 Tax=Cellulomonas flavigena (strain ATCC 482 / DSM 20109 / BCRC 11376 / JCM 18109 / NBRC 3775 / NCIMB 8073 / NRS 134) TaxID=446466 RepID=D5UCP6_CELFN|nr:sugar-binding protein [Cellulomonas flavigena]ADG76281.1 putative sugar uptake ABC transporter periplasmic solute-binding protein precursor [Cellulomonas flavigena DSM 20109]